MTAVSSRYLQPHVLNWLQTELKIGPAIGNVFYLAVSDSAMHNMLKANGVPDSLIYHTLTSVEDVTTTRQNDVILASPGLYTETASITWDKDNVHVVGLGGHKLNHSDWSLTQGCPVFYTATTTQAEIVNLTGERNTFHNALFENYGNNGACLAAVKVNGYGNSFYNCGFNGIMTTNQVATAACCSLDIAAGGYYSYFEDCLIGQSEWGTRTSTTSGHLRFTGTTGGGPAHGHFHNCAFRSASDTAGVPMVYIVGNVGASRYWRYTDCMFYNFATDYTSMSTVFSAPAGSMNASTHIIERCTAVGYTEWQVRDFPQWVMSAMPITGTAGGLAKQPTGLVGF